MANEDRLREYLKRVTAEVNLEPGLELELGTAYMRVARVQGVNISPNLGQTSQADAAEQKAQALIDSVLAHQPANRTALLRAGQIAHDRMILAGDAHREEEALRLAHVAVDRLDQYLRVTPLNAASNRADAQQVILALINIGNRYLKAGQSEEAIRICERAFRIARTTNWHTQAGAAGIVVAMAHRSRGELEEAVAAIRDQIAGNPAGVYDFPTVEDGVSGMAFLETAVKSASSNSKWTQFVETK